MWGSGILNGFRITMRNFFRGPITLQYPEQRYEMPERSRWAVRQVHNEDGSPRCTACLICERECPDHIIHITTSKNDQGAKHIDSYVYEQGACMMCGLCVAACPYAAIEMSHEYELACGDKSTLVRTLLEDVDAAPIRRAKPEAAKAAASGATDTADASPISEAMDKAQPEEKGSAE